jgi:hypothetical protein
LLTKQTLRNIISKAGEARACEPEPMPSLEKRGTEEGTKEDIRKLQLLNIQLTEKNKTLNYIIKQFKVKKPEEILSNLSKHDSALEEKYKAMFNERVDSLEAELAKSKNDLLKSFEDNEQLKVEFFNSKRKLLKL